MNLNDFFASFLMIINEMSPYLLLGFLIAGVLHVFVPKKFYAKFLSNNNKFSVVWSALLGIPLPLCSCGVIPTAIGLKNEKASKGAVASFLIATPQTGIDSILATFSLMGLGFALIRPIAALVTGVCGGLLVNKYIKKEPYQYTDYNCEINNNTKTRSFKSNKIYKVLKYAYFDMIQDIGFRLIIGLLIATLINVAVPNEFFLNFGSQPLLQMLVILIIAVPMYICSTGSIPIAATLIIKGLSPGAALVMLMAGPAVNMASVLVVKKSLGSKFTIIYLSTIIIGSIIFGLLTNILPAFDNASSLMHIQPSVDPCCEINTSYQDSNTLVHSKYSIFNKICSILLIIFIVMALVMKFLSRFRKTNTILSKNDNNMNIHCYEVHNMNCNHCKKAVENSVIKLKGVQSANANLSTKSLTVVGNPKEEQIRQAVEEAGFVFKGKKNVRT
ncbi:MAG: SO_0444 family Cu/Zn efflux transporter [Bacteroidales bacterium]